MFPLKILLSPIKVGNVELRNRVVLTPAGTNDCAGPEYFVSERLIAYHEARAKAGCGLNIVEVTSIEPRACSTVGGPAIWSDAHVPSWRALAQAVHRHDGKIFCQLAHMGRQATSALIGGRQIIGPSAHPAPSNMEVPHELTVEEIEELYQFYAEAARRAREAGLDGVEIHSAHDYLPSQFLSAISNKRTDDYGGTLEARTKFTVSILENVRAKVGHDFTVGVRIVGREVYKGGRTPAETQVIARILEVAGYDYISISGGIIQNADIMVAAIGTPPGTWIEDSAAVKQVVNIPVLVASQLGDPHLAELVLEHGKADMIGMLRSQWADPELVKKAAAGRFEDICPCTYCSTCLDKVAGGEAAWCQVNPAFGRECEPGWGILIPAEKPKKVMVVGGGPGGLEAARVAALRGHEVSLYEKDDRLGGQLNLACIPPYMQVYATVVKYLATQVKKAGVSINLNADVSPELVYQAKPDVVIVATGAQPLTPDIKGVDKPNVVTAYDVLQSKKTPAEIAKAVIIGGGLVGCETADYIAERGDFLWNPRREVTIIEMLPDIAMDAIAGPRTFLMRRLRDDDVKWITSATVKEILDDGVVYEIDGREESIHGMDTIILAVGAKSVDSLSDKIKGKVAEAYVIGDAKEPRRIVNATHEGAEVARKI
jgi:2,4-dienoyl-CoA reductase-like NADH-dependent reductase (Old Yellow Enzyme family)/thioredoxin reductase